MNVIDRAKKIMFSPKDEWAAISQETTSISQVFTGYLIILALIPAIAKFIGYSFIGYNIPFVGHIPGSVSIGIRYGVIAFVSPILGAFISAWVVDILAPTFGSVKDMTKSFQLVVYSFTPMLVAGVFYILPSLAIIAGLAGIYGLYLLYVGIKPMKQTPDEKVTGYFIVSLLVIIVVYFVLAAIFSALFISRSLIMGM